MSEHRPQSRLMVLMFTDLVDSVQLKQRLGDAVVARLIDQHDELFRSTVAAFSLAEILKDLGDGFLASFGSASDAVHAALHFQHVVHHTVIEGQQLKVRIGLHLGEVSELQIEATTGKPKLSGLAVDLTARVMSLALPGQILMTRAAFDNARQYVREHQSSDGENPAVTRKWMAHGRYLFKGADEPLEIFEVGEVGIAPLSFPPGSDKARRSVAADQEETLGWRPAVGLEIPERKNWVLERKLGEGGFGEVWLGENTKSHTRRVFKFCFDAERLRSFKRELMLFRLLRDALGDRHDIAKLYEVQVDHAPFYLEGEFTEDGSLVEWAQSQGGIDKVPLDTRLDIVARTAIAVSAAHSVGVLHKDIKPSNILIYRSPEGDVLPRLTDFGIGELTDPSQLAKRNITNVDIADPALAGSESSRTGTRLYAPPEALVGKPFTIQGDVYALGILLYQMVVGDLDRPLAQGWERDVADPLLREDICDCVEGHETERLSSAKQLAERLRNLPARHRALHRWQIARVGMAASIVLAVLLSLAAVWIVRERRMRLDQQREAEKALAVSRFLQIMLTSVDPREAEGRNVKVVDKLNQAVRQIDDGELSGKPEIEASVRSAIGNAYRAVSQYADAEMQLQKSLDARRQLLSSPHLEIAQNLEDLGAIKWNNAQYVEAEGLFRESLNMRRALHEGDHLDVASSLNYLAACLDKMEDRHEEAETFYRQALDMRRKLAQGDDRKLIARSLNNLGTCLRDKGEYEEAERLLNEAIALTREMKGSQFVDVANGLSNLAILFMKKHDYEKAEAHFLEALKTKREVYGDVHSSVAITLHGLADLNLRRGNLDQAELYGREAADIRRKTLREQHPRLSESLDLLADSLQGQNKHDQAEPILREVYQNRSQTLAAGAPEIARSAVRLGACLSRLSQRETEAEELLTWGYEQFKTSGNGNEAVALDAARSLIAIYERTNRPDQAAALRQALPLPAATQTASTP